MKIAVLTIPFIKTQSHMDLMVASFNSFYSDKHELVHYGVVNSCRPEDMEYLFSKYYFLAFNSENCLARAWNIGIRQAIADKCDYILIPNLDVIFKQMTIDNLVDFAEEHKEVHMLSSRTISNNHPTEDDYEVSHVNMWDNYSTFMMRATLPGDLGLCEFAVKEPIPGFFDENIKPAYCEDQDYQYRLEKYGFKHICVASSQYAHLGNGTIKGSEDEEKAKEDFNESHSMNYMKKKWGGIRADMVYNKPYG